MTKQLPPLPDNLEWVITADADRFTVHLSHRPPPAATPAEAIDKQRSGGYILSHTHRHPTVITRTAWENEVINGANFLWTSYCEGNNHAVWADELMRGSK